MRVHATSTERCPVCHRQAPTNLLVFMPHPSGSQECSGSGQLTTLGRTAWLGDSGREPADEQGLRDCLRKMAELLALNDSFTKSQLTELQSLAYQTAKQCCTAWRSKDLAEKSAALATTVGP